METLDMRGKPCPIPVIETKKKLAGLPAGRGLVVLVDNDIARQNLEKLAAGKRLGFSHRPTPDGAIEVTLTVTDAAASADDDGAGGLVVAIGSDTMGRGDDELGAVLMKGFLFSLGESNPLPEHILFFNAGVHLTCAGSSVLADLQAMAKKGVTINSCGACLNYYRKTDCLQVGSVTNMFAIVETMARARRVVNL